MLKIQEARTANGLTRADLAELVGRKPRTIQAWELGQRHPRAQDIQKVAHALGVAISDLFSEEAD